jgi:aminoglycoside phosphotransferase (APT) family kinase protein
MRDDELAARALAVIARYEALPVGDADRVLVHGDLGFHNLGIDPNSFAVHGVFDYREAAFADRHHDFRYLLFDFHRLDLFDAAVAVYQSSVGVSIDRDRVALYNAACAITFLAFRVGRGSGDRPCGRALGEDLQWTKCAIDRANAPGWRW